MPANTSTKIYPDRFNMIKGMNRAVKPILLTEHWRTLFNMRPFFSKLTQVPRKRVFGTFCSADPAPVLVLATFPTGINDQAFVVGVTRSSVANIGNGVSVPLGNDDEGTLKFNYSTVDYERWGTTFYNGELYFVNSKNGVKKTNGTSASSLSNTPCGRYLEHFHDHLIVGYPIKDGVEMASSVAWSHIYNFEEWTTKTFTEADHMEFSESRHGGEAVVSGVTGIGRMGDQCYVYTPSAIYQIQYVGIKEGVFKYAPVFQSIGNGFPYGLVITKDAHFFPDLNRKTFFRLDANGPKEIGVPVMNYIMDEINQDSRLAMRLYGYVNYQYREIHWVFVSYASTGKFDREVVYNYDNDTWYAGSVENVHSFCPSVSRPKAVSELTGTVGDLVSFVKDLGHTGVTFPCLYGTDVNYVLAEETNDDAVTPLLEQSVPYMETGDFYYDDLAHFKEVESMVIHATYSVGSGIDVYFSVRNNVDDAVAWTLAGNWTPTLAETVLSSPRASGRIWRFMFAIRSSGVGIEVVLNPFTKCAERADAAPTFSFYTQNKTTFEFLCNDSENFAGYWYEFFPSHNVDYKWRLRFVLPANRTLNRIEIYRLNSSLQWQGQAWATDYSINAMSIVPKFATFPIVIFENSVQLWSAYQTSLGVIAAGVHEWILYGDKFSNPYASEWFYAKLFWADGTEEYMASAVCVGDVIIDCPSCGGGNPPPPPPPPPGCGTPVITASNLVVAVDPTIGGPPATSCVDYTLALADQVVTTGTLLSFAMLDGSGGNPTSGYTATDVVSLANPGTYYFRAYAAKSDGSCYSTADFSVTLTCTAQPDICGTYVGLTMNLAGYITIGGCEYQASGIGSITGCPFTGALHGLVCVATGAMKDIDVSIRWNGTHWVSSSTGDVTWTDSLSSITDITNPTGTYPVGTNGQGATGYFNVLSFV